MAKFNEPGPDGSCPLCGEPVSESYRPFCSKRCKQVDLGRWFGETYRIPAEEQDEFSENTDEPEYDA